MRPFVYTGKLTGFEYIPASLNPHPHTGKVDPTHDHVRLSPEQDAMVLPLAAGVWLVYPDGATEELRSAMAKAGTVADVWSYLDAATASAKDKLAPEPVKNAPRALALCVAGHDAVAMTKAPIKDKDDGTQLDRL
jgi:hypothetical protein